MNIIDKDRVALLASAARHTKSVMDQGIANSGFSPAPCGGKVRVFDGTEKAIFTGDNMPQSHDIGKD